MQASHCSSEWFSQGSAWFPPFSVGDVSVSKGVEVVGEDSSESPEEANLSQTPSECGRDGG